MGCHFLLQCVKVKSESEVAQSCLTLSDPIECSLPGSSVHGIFAGKSPGVGCHSLLQGIFPTQQSNPGLLHCRRILYLLHQGSPGWCAFIPLFGSHKHPLCQAPCLRAARLGVRCKELTISWSKGSSIVSKGVQTQSPDSPVRETSSRGVICAVFCAEQEKGKQSGRPELSPAQASSLSSEERPCRWREKTAWAKAGGGGGDLSPELNH